MNLLVLAIEMAESRARVGKAYSLAKCTLRTARNAWTIVADQQFKPAVVAPCSDCHAAGLFERLDAMTNGVFHNRLHNQEWNQSLFGARLDHHFDTQTVGESCLLDLQVEV